MKVLCYWVGQGILKSYHWALLQAGYEVVVSIISPIPIRNLWFGLKS